MKLAALGAGWLLLALLCAGATPAVAQSAAARPGVDALDAGGQGGAVSAAPLALPPAPAPRSVRGSTPSAAAPPQFRSAADAFRLGLEVYGAGDKPGAVRALEYAATQGHAAAQWKLGRMFADGDGVPADDLRAFEYFSRLADENADIAPDMPASRLVANAFTVLGAYLLQGIPNTYVKADPPRARQLLEYAATYFGDADAQYRLGRLLLDGPAGGRDARRAAQWLNLSADKGHHQSQAVLGRLLVTGEGVPRQVPLGLMWLALARDGADPVREAWIVDFHEKALSQARSADVEAAERFLERRKLAKR